MREPNRAAREVKADAKGVAKVRKMLLILTWRLAKFCRLRVHWESDSRSLP